MDPKVWYNSSYRIEIRPYWRLKSLESTVITA